MSNSPRARALAAEVRAARKGSGMSQGLVAEQLGWSIAKVSRIETAQRGLTAADLTSILAVLRIRGQRREYLLGLAEELDHPAWWEAMSGLSAHVRATIDAEQRASRIAELALAYVPGLLQIRAYSEAVLGGNGAESRNTDEAANVWQVRQGILHRAEPVSFEAFLDESVLRRPVGGPAVAARQLRHLAEQQAEHVSVRVLPTELGAHIGLNGAFTLIEFAHGMTSVLVQSQESGALLAEPDEDAPFRDSLAELDRVALNVADSRDLISTHAGYFESQQEIPEPRRQQSNVD